RIFYYFDGDSPGGRPYLNRNEIILVSSKTQSEILQRYGGYHQARWQSFGIEKVPAVHEFLSGMSIEHASPFEVTPLIRNEKIYDERRREALELLRIESLADRRLVQLS